MGKSFLFALFLTLFVLVRYIINYVSTKVMTAKQYLIRTIVSFVSYFGIGFLWCFSILNINSLAIRVIVSLICGIATSIGLTAMDDNNKKPDEFIEPSQTDGYSSIDELTGKEGSVVQKIEDKLFLGKLKTNEDIIVRGDLSDGDDFIVEGMKDGYIIAKKKEVN